MKTKGKKLKDGLFCSSNVIFLSSPLVMTEQSQAAGRTVGHTLIVMH